MPPTPAERTRILKEMGWKPFKMPGVPRAVVEAENRRNADYIAGWAAGMLAHMEKVDASLGKERGKRLARKRV